MKRTLATSILVLSAILAQADVTGKWVGTMKESGIMPAGASGKVIAKGPQYSLTLNKDGSYSMVTTTPKTKISTKGTWKRTGSELTLMPSAESKKVSPNVQDRKLKIGAGEKTLVMEMKARMMMSMPAHTGKIDTNDKAAMEKLMKDSKEVTMSVEFKRG